MTDLEKQFTETLTKIYKRIRATDIDRKNHRLYAANIQFEAVFELFLSSKMPNLTTTVKASVLRSLIECVADAHAVYHAENIDEAAEVYVNAATQAFKNTRALITKWGTNRGKNKRPYEDLNSGKWNGDSLMNRIVAIDNGASLIHLYDLLCYFCHVNPLRQALIPVVNKNDLLDKLGAQLTFRAIGKMLYTSGLFTGEEIEDLGLYQSLL